MPPLVASDSRTKGFLRPNTPPPPIEGDDLTNIFHDLVTGITGLDGSLVRPRWQQQPPVTPAINVDWCAIGSNNTSSDWQPVFYHVSDDPEVPEGYDIFQRMETTQAIATFYGPNGHTYANILRDGLFIDQNAAFLRQYAMCVVEVHDLEHIADLFREQWRDATSVPFTVRREIRRIYPVRTLLRSTGTITANAPFSSERTITHDFDTDKSKP